MAEDRVATGDGAHNANYYDASDVAEAGVGQPGGGLPIDMALDGDGQSAMLNLATSQNTVDSQFGTPVMAGGGLDTGGAPETFNPVDSQFAQLKEGETPAGESMSERLNRIERMPPSEQGPYLTQLYKQGLMSQGDYIERLADNYGRSQRMGDTNGNERRQLARHINQVMQEMSPSEQHTFRMQMAEAVRRHSGRRS